MSESHIPKYAPPPPVVLENRRWPGKTLTRAPAWCSVDLRDGNQALPNPLHPEQKLEYFRMLCGIGFKEIEIAFPSASQDDFDFTRRLIEEGHIPDDVFIMGLTQCRAHLIERTFEAFAGVRKAIVHAYIATSGLHMRQVFHMTRDETLAAAVRATEQIRALADTMPESDIRYQFSPEEFTDTDPAFALEICEAIFEAWGKATPAAPLILNLPATVERRPPNQYADLIEWFSDHFSKRDAVLLSVHSHNDQGMAVAASEMTLLAGADRVEGTLFGHGERTGNVDLVTLANNLFSRGIDTGLDFSHLPDIAATVERLTGMPVPYRQPYAGEYVFTAFSGSHQDAIRKGIQERHTCAEVFGKGWNVPYLHVDPADLGRAFERLIRINSQSGKGGAAWVLEQEYGFDLPKPMLPALGKAVQAYVDKVGREIGSDEVRALFEAAFVNPEGAYTFVSYAPDPVPHEGVEVEGSIVLRHRGETRTVHGRGNGPISVCVHALQSLVDFDFHVGEYKEHALRGRGDGEDAQAICYIQLKREGHPDAWGVGIHTNTTLASMVAVVAAFNQL